MAEHLNLEAIQRRFEQALVDHERRVLLDLVTQELPRLTLGQLAEILQSSLGSRLRELPATVLLNPGGHAAPRKASDPPHVESTRATATFESKLRGAIASLESTVRSVLAGAEGPMSAGQLRQRVGCTDLKLSLALRSLISQGLVTRSGVARGTRYELAAGAIAARAQQALDPTAFDTVVLEVLQAKGDWVARQDLLKTLNCAPEALRAALHRLVAQGSVRRSRSSQGSIYRRAEPAPSSAG